MRRAIAAATAAGLAVGAALLGASPAWAKPRVDWCAEVTRASQQSDDVNRQLAVLNDTIAQQVRVAQSGNVGEGGTASSAAVLQAQINALENRKLVVEERQQLIAKVTAAIQLECNAQEANPPRCSRKQPRTAAQLTAAQRRDLEQQEQAVLGDTANAYPVLGLLYRCPTGAPINIRDFVRGRSSVVRAGDS